MKTLIIKAHDRDIARAVGKLKKGGIIIYPTETAYGIGADFLNPSAIRKVYRIKRRPKEKMLSVIVGSTAVAKRYVKLNRLALRLVKKFMPGPLTLVSESKSGNLSVAWRIPGHWIALELAKRFGRPITATSANISGKPPMYRFEDVKKTFSGKVDVIINAGNLPKRTPSTILEIGTMKLLRRGAISKKAVLAALKGSR